MEAHHDGDSRYHGDAGLEIPAYKVASELSSYAGLEGIAMVPQQQ